MTNRLSTPRLLLVAVPLAFMGLGATLFVTAPEASAGGGSEYPTTTRHTYPTTTKHPTTTHATTTTIVTTNPNTAPTTATTTTTTLPTTTTTLASTTVPRTTHPPRTTTTTSPPTPGLFALNIFGACPDGVTPLISITFGNRPDLNGQTGPLEFSTGGSQNLTFQSGATVTIPYPPSAGTGPVDLLYTLGAESAEASVEFPENCTPGTTTAPGTTTTTTTLPGETTTTLPATTTTLPFEGLEIGSAASVCSRDVPFIDITFGNQPEFNGITGTITFQLLDGTTIESVPVTYQANETVRLIYPGAEIDPVTGEATDWPGWLLNDDGFWVLDPSDAAFRDGLIVVASLPIPADFIGGSIGQSVSFGRSVPILQQVPGETVTATTTITYPPETAACNSPEGPFPPGFVPPGGDTFVLVPAGAKALGVTLMLGGALFLGGADLVLFVRRRRGGE